MASLSFDPRQRWPRLSPPIESFVRNAFCVSGNASQTRTAEVKSQKNVGMRESINDPQAAISYHHYLLHRFCRWTCCNPYGVFTTSASNRSPVSAIPTAERRSWPHLLWRSLDDEAMERYSLHVSSDSKSGDVDCAWHLECRGPRCSRSRNCYMSLLLQINGVIGQPVRNVGYRFSFQHAMFALRRLDYLECWPLRRSDVDHLTTHLVRRLCRHNCA